MCVYGKEKEKSSVLVKEVSHEADALQVQTQGLCRVFHTDAHDRKQDALVFDVWSVNCFIFILISPRPRPFV